MSDIGKLVQLNDKSIGIIVSEKHANSNTYSASIHTVSLTKLREKIYYVFQANGSKHIRGPLLRYELSFV